jgi:hypothetical protein
LVEAKTGEISTHGRLRVDANTLVTVRMMP